MSQAWYLQILQTVLSASIGAVVVYLFGLRHLRNERRLAFRERQLAEFYAPLAGIRKQIAAKRAVSSTVSEAAGSAWPEISRLPSPENEAKFAPYQAIVDYDNDQLRTEIVPLYRKMLALFTERYHLAASDTRTFYEQFLEFVEIWNRWLDGALPIEVLARINHSEEAVRPFYDHLEAKMQELQDEVASE